MAVTTHDLYQDVDRFERAIAAQLAKDPDHEVALAMFRADLRRAKANLTAYIRRSVEEQTRRRHAEMAD
jgi:hypothetical protein